MDLAFRVTVLETQPLMRKAIASALETIGVECLAFHDNGVRMVASLRASPATVLVVDPEFEPGGGVSLVQELRRALPKSALLCFSATRNRTLVQRWQRVPGVVYLDKLAAETSDLAGAIQAAFAASHNIGNPPEAPNIDDLTDKEVRVLKLVAEGCDNVTAAACLEISESTLKKHVVALYRKLNCESRVQLARVGPAANKTQEQPPNTVGPSVQCRYPPAGPFTPGHCARNEGSKRHRDQVANRVVDLGVAYRLPGEMQ
jgi:two-component system nitrate/nitrite response regulator NarL